MHHLCEISGLGWLLPCLEACFSAVRHDVIGTCHVYCRRLRRPSAAFVPAAAARYSSALTRT
jgi:hypothetical protein